MPKRNNLVGKVFGRLTVIERVEPHICPSGQRKQMYLCKCSCGKEVIVNYAHLVTGHTQSCGCYLREVVGKCNMTHGKTHTRLYKVWANMNGRCYGKNNAKYHNYGGRGIRICDEWLGKNGFQNFYDWAMANGYKPDAKYGECTLDRIDVNGNYEPSNCRLTNLFVQANNKTNNPIYEINGIKHTLPEWSRIHKIDVKRVRGRVFSGWSIEKALNTPINPHQKIR